VLSKPKKVSLGNTCPVCDVKEPSREHVSRHFGDELLEIVMNFEDPGDNFVLSSLAVVTIVS
jgi:hypothetical protein